MILFGEFENALTALDMWNQFKIAYGATSATRLCVLTLKFEQCSMDPKSHLWGPYISSCFSAFVWWLLHERLFTRDILQSYDRSIANGILYLRVARSV